MQIHYELSCNKILIAIKELELWESRQKTLSKNLKLLGDIKGNNKKLELNKVKRQINYYDSLTKDMKKEFRPSTISEFLNSISAF
jgi:hypothetical protein